MHISMALINDTTAIQERLVFIKNCVKDIYKECKKNRPTLYNIKKLQEKIKQERKLTPHARVKLRNLFSTALHETENEEEYLRKALDKIYEIRAIRLSRRIVAKHSGNKETIRRGALMKLLQTSAQTLPLWTGRKGEKPSPLIGAIPADVNYVAKIGDMVAALVKGPDGDENWILAEVVQWHPSSGKYEVDDIDEEQKERHMLSKRRVVPLPIMRANPKTNPEALFPKGATVMALYPQTTCFYKAITNQIPSLPTDEYEVLFEDASYSEGYSPPLNVPQRYVIPMKEKKK